MELLTPTEHAIVTRCDPNRAEVSYVLEIKGLMHAMDRNTAICATAVSLFNEIKAMLDDSDVDIVDLGPDYCDVFSRLSVLLLDFKKFACVDEDLLNTRHDLLLGLSEAHQGWISGSGMRQSKSWFYEKASTMRNLVDLYETEILKNTNTLKELQFMKAQIWLALSHSRTIRCLIK